MQTIYVDTSVFGGCFDEEFKEWSNKLMQSFTPQKHLCILSDLTLLELENAPENVKDILEGIPNECKALAIVDQEGKNLASAYIEAEAVIQKYYNDALHIAIASINRIDVLVSWNFKHIVNLNRIRIFNSVNLRLGYPVLEIRSPREILEE